MNKILLPIDFSESTKVSLKYAINLISDQDVTLHLFHIYPDQLMIPDSSFPTGMDSDAFLNTEFITELRKQAEKNMLDTEKELREELDLKGHRNVKIESLVTGGDPEWEINEICENITPNLIIMGTRGEGNKGFLEGSMAEKIMIKSCQPVLAVPQTYTDKPPRNIMYATNFNVNDYENIGIIMDLFKTLDIKLHIVHFSLGESNNNESVVMNTLQNSLSGIFSDDEFNCSIVDGKDKSNVIQTFAEENKIDLIAFIAHKNNIFKNLFSKQIHKKDFFKLELPMLAVHE